jgi:hypothetical protein
MSDFIIKNDVLIKYTGQSENVHVPEGVVKLGDSVFYDLHNIDTVYLPEGLIEIDSWAFNRASVRSIQIPHSLQIIRDGAFELCRQLTSVAPRSMAYSEESEGCVVLSDCKELTIMEDSAFNGCKGIRKVRLPKSLLKISRAAFFDCRNLEIVTLGNETQRIEKTAFTCFLNLKCMYIPKSVIFIDQAAFYNIGREDEQETEILVEADIVEKMDLLDMVLDEDDLIAPDGMVRIDLSHPKPTDLTIWGTPGSFAQEYAKNHDFPFYSEEILNRMRLDLYTLEKYHKHISTHRVGDITWFNDMKEETEDVYRRLEEEYRLLYSSAKCGDINAQYEIALFHRNYDWGVDCAEEYLKWMTEAAQNGHMEAMLECARVLIRKEIFLTKDRKLKIKCSDDSNKAAAGFLKMILAGGDAQAQSEKIDFSIDTVKEAAHELAAIYADADSGLYDLKEAGKIYSDLALYCDNVAMLNLMAVYEIFVQNQSADKSSKRFGTVRKRMSDFWHKFHKLVFRL